MLDLSRAVHAAFPNRTGVAVFLHGPFALAVAAGMAFSAQLFDVLHVPRYTPKGFVAALVLPRGPVPAVEPGRQI